MISNTKCVNLCMSCMQALPATSSPKETSFTSDPTTEIKQFVAALSNSKNCLPFATFPDTEKPMGTGTSFL